MSKFVLKYFYSNLLYILKENIYEKFSYCNSQSFVITTIVYALLVPVFFEMDNVYGGGENFVDDNNNDKHGFKSNLYLWNITY